MEIHDSTKRNLLITLGDSWTYGVGVDITDIELLNLRVKSLERFNTLKDRYNEFSWANLVAKTFNRDLINLSVAGSSNSTMSRLFINENYKNLTQIYNKVDVIFLLTDPYRFSFYSGGNIKNYSVRSFQIDTKDVSTHTILNEDDDLKNWYLQNVSLTDSIFETVFNITAIKQFCELNGYGFYWGTAFTDYNDVYNIFNFENCIHKGEFRSFGEYLYNMSYKNVFSNCGHPNENGYQLIADYMIEKLSDKL